LSRPAPLCGPVYPSAGQWAASGPQDLLPSQGHSGADRGELAAACKRYLSGHEGTVFFATGTLARDVNREVNDHDFEVSLHLVFSSKAAHDQYQQHPRHPNVIEENPDTWEKVRMFDSYLSPAPPTPAGG
jgi:hypothetical protein